MVKLQIADFRLQIAIVNLQSIINQQSSISNFV